MAFSTIVVDAGILFDEAGGEAIELPDQVVGHQYLPIATNTGADPDGGDGDIL